MGEQQNEQRSLVPVRSEDRKDLHNAKQDEWKRRSSSFSDQRRARSQREEKKLAVRTNRYL